MQGRPLSQTQTKGHHAARARKQAAAGRRQGSAHARACIGGPLSPSPYKYPRPGRPPYNLTLTSWQIMKHLDTYRACGRHQRQLADWARVACRGQYFGPEPSPLCPLEMQCYAVRVAVSDVGYEHYSIRCRKQCAYRPWRCAPAGERCLLSGTGSSWGRFALE